MKQIKIISLKNCQPCRELKAMINIAGFDKDTEVIYIEDMDREEKKKYGRLVGLGVPHLIVNGYTVHVGKVKDKRHLKNLLKKGDYNAESSNIKNK